MEPSQKLCFLNKKQVFVIMKKLNVQGIQTSQGSENKNNNKNKNKNRKYNQIGINHKNKQTFKEPRTFPKTLTVDLEILQMNDETTNKASTKY